MIALKRSTRAPTAPLANCASYLASPPSSPRVFGWLLRFFSSFEGRRRIRLHCWGCRHPCRTHPNSIAPKTIKYSSPCAPHWSHIPPLPRLHLFGLLLCLIIVEIDRDLAFSTCKAVPWYLCRYLPTCFKGSPTTHDSAIGSPTTRDTSRVVSNCR